MFLLLYSVLCCVTAEGKGVVITVIRGIKPLLSSLLSSDNTTSSRKKKLIPVLVVVVRPRFQRHRLTLGDSIVLYLEMRMAKVVAAVVERFSPMTSSRVLWAERCELCTYLHAEESVRSM